MVKRLNHFAIQNILYLFEIDNHASDRVRLAFQGHLKHVVVTVAARVGCLAINLAVPGIAYR